MSQLKPVRLVKGAAFGGRGIITRARKPLLALPSVVSVPYLPICVLICLITVNRVATPLIPKHVVQTSRCENSISDPGK